MKVQAPAQPFSLHLLRRGLFEVAARSDHHEAPSFDGAGSLARFLRSRRRPVMATRTRCSRALARCLDSADVDALQRAGAVALIPVLDGPLLIGFVVLGGRTGTRECATIDPMRVVELTTALATRLSTLRRAQREAGVVPLRATSFGSPGW
ncbi:MAG: hypothetical protein JRH01_19480 [Deltaproteobacteria bacterium]|nr:hypothetical protein [Deltaproteobacteria bacterium]MBW2395532.1 hypothetical protein [Deltaproteobacteria bacterium]